MKDFRNEVEFSSYYQSRPRFDGRDRAPVSRRVVKATKRKLKRRTWRDRWQRFKAAVAMRWRAWSGDEYAKGYLWASSMSEESALNILDRYPSKRTEFDKGFESSCFDRLYK